ncbi:MAG: S-layer homology domain-containing protein [Oscillospiraceae bacterium]|nr:S-layer homology domain-containing protein [Oscillospiraceae bacterium]
MKKLTSILLALSIFMSAFVFDVGAAELTELAGSYEGWYYAAQGQTGLTLTINADGTGVFEFYNMPGKTNAKNGSYTIKATVTSKGFRVDGDKWIDHPSGYAFVSLEGELSGGLFKGNASGNTREFVLTKNNESYQQVLDSVNNGHRYELFDESLTWPEAKAACEEMGGHLAVITSQEEQSFIEGLMNNGGKKQYWIGMTTDNNTTAWVTGEAVTYKNFDSGEPNRNRRSDGERENYVHIYNEPNPARSSSKRFRWNDIFYDNTYPGEEKFFSLNNVGYICEWETWSDAAQWSTPELQEAAELGLIPDVLVGKDMTKPITRGEFAAVSVNLFEAMTGGRAVMSSSCKFKDIQLNENRNYILKAYNIGSILGYSEDTFAPDDLLLREQLAAMLCRVYKKAEWPEWTIDTDDEYTINYSGVKKFADDEFISDYARPSVYFMVKYNVLSGIGDNKFAPRNSTPSEESIGYANATREQAVVMSLRSFENLKID